VNWLVISLSYMLSYAFGVPKAKWTKWPVRWTWERRIKSIYGLLK